MSDQNTSTDTPAAEITAKDFVIEYSVPGTGGDGEPPLVKRTADLAQVPPRTRLDILIAGFRTAVTNRVNVRMVRARKALAPYLAFDAWQAYRTAMAADPMQTTVPRPEGDEIPADKGPDATKRPTLPDPAVLADEAIASILKGEFNAGTSANAGKSRQPKDPLVKAITGIVLDQVLKARRAENSSFKLMDAQKEVGTDGLAYLNAQIDAKVAAEADAAKAAELRKQLEKTRDDRYVKPARIMLGLDVPKAQSALPSIF